jgi:glyoxylase I family protein
MHSPFNGVNHVGYVVTDLDQAIAFAVDILGFELVPERAGFLRDDSGDLMTRRFGVPAPATAEFRFVRAGDAPIEFLAWSAPDQMSTPARNCDVAGRHLAVNVTDMPAALERIRTVAGVEIREPNERGYIYVRTPFGLEVQLIPVSGGA